jgi:phospholipid-binding lipoprotein MlaA
MLVTAVSALLAGCSVAPPGAQIHDPYESMNRNVHDFNKGLDSAILRPVGTTVANVPPEITDRVVNFADNTGLPGMVLNGLLQGDIGGAATNTMRFVLNSTVGVLGLFDPADAIGLYEDSTDFGETLHVWGVPEGAYLELPGFGPSTERDAVGLVVDFIIDPLDRVGNEDMSKYGLPTRIGTKVIDRGRFSNTVDSVLYDSADSYAQARILYLQNRRFELGDTSADAYIDPYADPYADPVTSDPALDPYFDPYQDQ